MTDKVDTSTAITSGSTSVKPSIKKKIFDKGNVVGEFFQKNITRAIHSFASSTPIVMTLVPLVISIVIRDPKGALISAGCIVNLIGNVIFKHMIKQKPVFVEGLPKKICTAFKDYEIPSHITQPSNDFRMPSEHCQTVGFIMGFFLAKMIFDRKFNLLSLALLAVLVFLVSWSRYKSKCHTMPQVAVGAVIGIALGAGYYRLVKECYEGCGKDTDETKNLCLSPSDGNAYTCETIRDGYVVNSDENKEDD